MLYLTNNFYDISILDFIKRNINQSGQTYPQCKQIIIERSTN
jgi:hypothetical protein